MTKMNNGEWPTMYLPENGMDQLRFERDELERIYDEQKRM
jgi:hypothetical protein